MVKTSSAASEPHARHYHGDEEGALNEPIGPEKLEPTPASRRAEARKAKLAQLSHKYEDLKDLSEDNLAQYTCLMTAFQRSLESKREDALIHDPFAGMLAGEAGLALAMFMSKAMKIDENREAISDSVAIRSRLLDEALLNRHEAIEQVVLLGAGLDTRAFRMDTLSNCSVFEIDAAKIMLNRKQRIFEEQGVKPISKSYHAIAADLADDAWDQLLQAEGFNPNVPTFWVMEGLLAYMDQASIVRLLKTINALSARCSQLWTDLCSRAFVEYMRGWGAPTEQEGLPGIRAMQYGENDPMNGILTILQWHLEMQVDLGEPGEYFGRSWKPLMNKANAPGAGEPEVFSFFFMLATKTTMNSEPAPLP